MDFITKTMSNIANTAGISATAVVKCIATSVSRSTEEKTSTITKYLGTPNAKLVLHLLFLQALVVFGAKRESMLILKESQRGGDGEESDHQSDGIIVPSKVACWLERKTRFGICWVSAFCGMLVTAHVAFDVLFSYKIERVGIRGGSKNGASETIKEAIRFAENLFESLSSS